MYDLSVMLKLVNDVILQIAVFRESKNRDSCGIRSSLERLSLALNADECKRYFNGFGKLAARASESDNLRGWDAYLRVCVNGEHIDWLYNTEQFENERLLPCLITMNTYIKVMKASEDVINDHFRKQS